jgi:2,5-diamino-6-(ribosylamino)-4(3H)-pyrimidinone 5'-phosphate reductase
MATGRPHVVVHVAVSLDGATTGFDPDVGRFYELARTWREDVTLVGADTILAQQEALAAVPRPGPAPDGPLLAVVDGRARVARRRARPRPLPRADRGRAARRRPHVAALPDLHG